MELKFYFCKHCGKIIALIKDTKVSTVCCGEEMAELLPGVTDAASEKHVPVIDVYENVVTVNVGEVAHPMLAEHYIEWILLKTDKGIQQKWLKPNENPSARFILDSGEKVESAYAYCNLHKLWTAKAK